MFRAKRTIRNEEDKGKEDYQEQRRQGQRGLSGTKKTRAKRTIRNKEDKGKEDYQERRRQGQRGLSGAKKTRAKRTIRNEEDKGKEDYQERRIQGSIQIRPKCRKFCSLLLDQLAQPEGTVNAS